MLGSLMVGRQSACATPSSCHLAASSCQVKLPVVTTIVPTPLLMLLPCALLQATHEWRDGVLARIMRTACKDEASDQKWILFDGPVDTLWIESMNTTLDDNKLLTLLSGKFRLLLAGQLAPVCLLC